MSDAARGFIRDDGGGAVGPVEWAAGVRERRSPAAAAGRAGRAGRPQLGANPVLGLMPPEWGPEQIEGQVTTMEAGEVLLLYTDGLTELCDDSGRCSARTA